MFIGSSDRIMQCTLQAWPRHCDGITSMVRALEKSRLHPPVCGANPGRNERNRTIRGSVSLVLHLTLLSVGEWVLMDHKHAVDFLMRLRWPLYQPGEAIISSALRMIAPFPNNLPLPVVFTLPPSFFSSSLSTLIIINLDL